MVLGRLAGHIESDLQAVFALQQHRLALFRGLSCLEQLRLEGTVEMSDIIGDGQREWISERSPKG